MMREKKNIFGQNYGIAKHFQSTKTYSLRHLYLNTCEILYFLSKKDFDIKCIKYDISKVKYYIFKIDKYLY